MKIKQKLFHSNESRVFFCSDLHYNHLNAIAHSSRPFPGLSEMNSYIEDELRKVLRSTDILFSLGDVFWNLSKPKCLEVLSLIPCRFYQVMGNHDRRNFWGNLGKELVERKGGVVADILDIVVDNTPVSLSHYPILSWNLKYHGSYHLHGHCHGGIDDFNSSSSDLRVDVGFDGELAKQAGSFLIPWDIINNHMKNKIAAHD